MTMDVYEHVLNDLNFNGRKVELLETFRRPLEKPGELHLC
jgi:hypothetical protein